MKLRLRNRETKETTKIEVPDMCTVKQLNETICSYCPSIGEPVFDYSLNGKDSIVVSSSQERLTSLGIASGDLVFFSPCSGSGPRPTVSEEVGPFALDGGEMDVTESITENKTLVSQGVGNDLGDGVLKNLDCSDSLLVGQEVEYDAVVTTGYGGTEQMDIDGKSLSEHHFLRKVLKEEVLCDGCDKKLLVAALHAVFLETSFVRCDPVSRKSIDGLHIANDWPAKGSSLSLFYTLPSLLSNEGTIELVKLRIQSMSIFVNVYASLGHCGLRSYRVCLDGNRFGPMLNSLRKDHDISENEMMKCEQEVFECWKMIKDQLAYPLLIELCEKTNLGLPPCLMLLPMELKVKILESLPGIDLARVGCVCKELWYLSSNDNLWEQKYKKEFGVTVATPRCANWKKNFVRIWKIKKHRTLPSNRLIPLLFPAAHPFPVPGFPIIRRDPDPIPMPSFLGGDYDRLPGLPAPPLRYPGFRILPYRQ